MKRGRPKISTRNRLLDACQALIDAYAKGAESEHVDWNDVDRAHGLAVKAVKKAKSEPPDLSERLVKSLEPWSKHCREEELYFNREGDGDLACLWADRCKEAKTLIEWLKGGGA